MVGRESDGRTAGEEAGEVIGSIDQPTQTRARASAPRFQKILLVRLATQGFKIGLELICEHKIYFTNAMLSTRVGGFYFVCTYCEISTITPTQRR